MRTKVSADFCRVLVVADRRAGRAMAILPMRRSPGCTSVPSSAMTLVDGPRVKVAVAALVPPSPAVDTELAMPMASEEPSVSTSSIAGVVAEQALLGGLAPHDAGGHDDLEATRCPSGPGLGVERAQDRPGEGVADDGGVVDAACARRRRAARPASKWRPVEGDHRPADGQGGEGVERAGAVHQRAGRQRADAGRRSTTWRTWSRSGSSGSRRCRRRAVVEHQEQVVVAPHHALGHAGGAAGVEQVEVVAGAAPRRRPCGRRRRPAAAS